MRRTAGTGGVEDGTSLGKGRAPFGNLPQASGLDMGGRKLRGDFEVLGGVG